MDLNYIICQTLFSSAYLRNMYRYEYITLLDTDEVIVPTNLTNWADLMEQLLTESGDKSSWVFRNVYFFDDMLEKAEGGLLPDIPHYLHMMQHVYRSDQHTPPGHYIKARLNITYLVCDKYFEI